MAQPEETPVSRTAFDDNVDDDDESSPWDELLDEAKQTSSKLQEHKKLIVLGDVGCGKTTLIAKLQGNEEPEKGSGLEFTHLTIRDEYREDSTKLGVWLLDGDATHTGLLKYALTPASFQDTLILVTASMSAPWSLLKSLTNWLSIITDHLDRLSINQDTLQQCQQKLVKQFQEYVEPDSNSTSRLSAPGGSAAADEDTEAVSELPPLGENTLINNLGIPVIVAVTKSDAISTLEKDMDYREEKFDFIQQHVRKLCLNYGAALCYVSVKEDKNCDLLSKYIAHRLYGLEFTSPASVIDRDTIFIPSGWDSDKKISILSENLMSIKADDDFDSVIKRPASLKRPANRDGEVSAEDDQEFLTKCNSLLAKGAPAAAASPAPANATAASPAVAASSGLSKSSSKSRLGTPPSSVSPSPKKPGVTFSSPKSTLPSPRVPTNHSSSRTASQTANTLYSGSSTQGSDSTKLGSQQGETVLANFFNSLLTKKTGSAGSPAKSSPDSKAARAELDRMTKNNKSSSGS